MQFSRVWANSRDAWQIPCRRNVNQKIFNIVLNHHRWRVHAVVCSCSWCEKPLHQSGKSVCDKRPATMTKWNRCFAAIDGVASSGQSTPPNILFIIVIYWFLHMLVISTPSLQPRIMTSTLPFTKCLFRCHSSQTARMVVRRTVPAVRAFFFFFNLHRGSSIVFFGIKRKSFNEFLWRLIESCVCVRETSCGRARVRQNVQTVRWADWLTGISASIDDRIMFSKLKVQANGNLCNARRHGIELKCFSVVALMAKAHRLPFKFSLNYYYFISSALDIVLVGCVALHHMMSAMITAGFYYVWRIHTHSQSAVK